MFEVKNMAPCVRTNTPLPTATCSGSNKSATIAPCIPTYIPERGYNPGNGADYWNRLYKFTLESC